MWHRIRTPVFKNTSSTARDHLAAERTFLSWMRSGLGFIALGIGIERFSQLDIEALRPAQATSQSNSTHPAQISARNDLRKQEAQGLVFGLLSTGTASVAYGAVRYFSNMRMLQQGLYKPSFYGAAGLSIAMAGLTGGAYWTLMREKEEGDG